MSSKGEFEVRDFDKMSREDKEKYIVNSCWGLFNSMVNILYLNGLNAQKVLTHFMTHLNQREDLLKEKKKGRSQ